MQSQSFSISTLPRYGTPQSDPTTPRTTDVLTAGAEARPTVWVVEDDGISRCVLARLLAGSGYTVEAMGSGEQAVRLAESGTLPRVLLVDLDLPGMNGIELIDQLRSRNASTLFVVVTASGDDALLSAVYARRVPVVRKPVDFGRLMELVESLADERLGEWSGPHRQAAS